MAPFLPFLVLEAAAASLAPVAPPLPFFVGPNDVSAHFFVALEAAYDRGILAEENVRGNATLEYLRDLYLMFEPPGNHL